MFDIGFAPITMGMPSRYVQGPGLLSSLGSECRAFSQKPFVLVDFVILREYEALIRQSLACLDGYELQEFEGECTRRKIESLAAAAKAKGCDFVVGIGGGKGLDTAKGAALFAGVGAAMVPTIASNDSPISRLAVLYTEEGVLAELLRLPVNPNLVLVDSRVIAKAPVRFLVAGIGDAVVTKFEAEAASRAGTLSPQGGFAGVSAMALAERCYSEVRENAEKAVAAVRQGLLTPAVERIIEANIFLSGVGFESCGLAAPHALTRGFSAIPEMHRSLHGEEVAFGLLVQFVLENRPLEFVRDFLDFYLRIGLPVCLADLGLKEAKLEDVEQIAEKALYKNSYIFNLPMHVDAAKLRDAILQADSLGSAVKEVRKGS